MAQAANAQHSRRLIDWSDVAHDFSGDLRFWFGGFWGWLALIFLLSDLTVLVGYLTQFSFFSNKGWLIAVIGGVIASGIAFVVHFGIHRSITRLPHWSLKIVGVLCTLAVVGLSVWFARSGAEDLWQMEIAAEASSVTSSTGLRDVAATERSTQVEQAAVDRTQLVLADATERRQTAEVWQGMILACSAQQGADRQAGRPLVPCSDVRGVQTALAIRIDGIALGETAEAVTTELEQARTAEGGSDGAYQAALAALAAKQAQLSTAVLREGQATQLETARTYLRTMRAFAADHHGVSYEENPELIQATAERYARRSGVAVAILVTLGSLMFGMFRFYIRDHLHTSSGATSGPDRLALMDRSGEPIPPDGGGAQVYARGDLDNVLEPAFIDRHTPRQPFETPGYLRAARDRLAKGYGSSYADDLTLRINDLDERAQRAMDAIALSERLREVEDLERRAKSAGARIDGGAARSTQRPPEPEIYRDPSDVEELERLRRHVEELERQAAARPARPAPEPEVAKAGPQRNPGGLYDGMSEAELASSLARLTAEFERLDAEQKGLNAQKSAAPAAFKTSAGARRLQEIDARLHEIHAEIASIRFIRQHLKSLAGSANG